MGRHHGFQKIHLAKFDDQSGVGEFRGWFPGGNFLRGSTLPAFSHEIEGCGQRDNVDSE